MVVTVTNLTDGPGKTPVQVDIYNKTLDPGGILRLPAELVDSKIRTLEKAGLVAIGPLPAWYSAAKQRKGRVLSKEEQMKRLVQPAPVTEPTTEDVSELQERRRRKG